MGVGVKSIKQIAEQYFLKLMWWECLKHKLLNNGYDIVDVVLKSMKQIAETIFLKLMCW